MSLAAGKAFGVSINLDKDMFHTHIFNSLSAETRRDILEAYIGGEGQVAHDVPVDYHPTQDLGATGLFSCIEAKLEQDFPLLSASLAGDDDDDCPWMVVFVGSTATISNGGIPFTAEVTDGDEHELQQMEEFIASYFPDKTPTPLVWASATY